MRYLFVIISFCAWLNVYGQHPLPPEETDFRNPLDIPILLSGAFGELRSNHFHTGLDIKTKSREGLEIYAIEDGYISRINSSPWGYGKAIYVTHPNGYTSVYAHLSGFPEPVKAYVRKMQYAREHFEIEVYPDPDQLRVTKGQLIAYSGNSGSSGGPHLHFEIRETESEVPMNPLLFGFKVHDSKPPVLSRLYIYNAKKPFQQAVLKKNVFSNSNGSYVISNGTVHVAEGAISFGIQAYDQMEESLNKNGVYEVRLFADGKLIYHFKQDKIPFQESRYLNAHIDYYERVTGGAKVHKCQLLPGNFLSTYRTTEQQGKIKLKNGQNRKIRYEVSDFFGNISLLEFTVTGFNPPQSIQEGMANPFAFHKQNKIEQDDFRANFPALAFYDSIDFQYECHPSKVPSIYSNIHKVHTATTPVHYSYDIAIKPNALPERLKNKALIVRQNDAGHIRSIGGTWIDSFLVSSDRSFGTFLIKADETPPRIKPVNIYNNKYIGNQKSIDIVISDDLAGIANYRATINGRWVLMEYDGKNARLSYEVEAWIKPGEHEFELLVEDGRKNESYYKIKFKR